jgi:hypothetical protein
MHGLMGVAPCCACSSQWLLPGFPVLAWLCVMKVWHAILVATDGQECLCMVPAQITENVRLCQVDQPQVCNP